MPEYTPGSWHLGQIPFAWWTYIHGPDGDVVAAVAEFTEDGDLVAYFGGKDQARANAQLIAAAPDLLEAAKEYLKGLECETYFFDGRLLAAKLNLKQAIAKAEGEEAEDED